MGIVLYNVRAQSASSHVAGLRISPYSEANWRGSICCKFNATIPYFKEMISMIPTAHSRPNIPEYPQIADNIRQAIDEVYHGIKTLNRHLMTLPKSAKALGWVKKL